MDKLEGMANVEPVRLGPDSRLKFDCHPSVKCFTRCCKDINIILTPYDIIRLKNRLNLSSEEFLALYTEPQILEKTDLPVVTLKLLDVDDPDSEGKACPFVRENGCLVYEDRPTTCRYYPLGVATLSHKEDPDGEEFYFFVNEPHCLGFEEDKEWTVSQWRENQGVDVHDKINAEWTELVVRKRSFPPNMQWTEQTKKMFFLVSYNIDKFREFVFESSFLQRYEIDAALLAEIKNDEIALLQFGLKWLKWLLFKEGDFKIKAGADAAGQGENA
ncbi:MAG: YkgJ family cysteine cluster protein [Deltaproteobacteria bacterium]|nr:YkgJ family cysteine cluster protein [Deltaproteobacteria bacterium]